MSREVRLHCEAFCRHTEQLVEALGADRRLLALSSSAEISVSQLEAEKDIFSSITKLSSNLHLVVSLPLSLTEARALYASSLLDTLQKILSRLQWRQFCSQLDALAAEGRGLLLAGCALSCVVELFHAWHRVQPSSDAHKTAQLEAFGRY